VAGAARAETLLVILPGGACTHHAAPPGTAAATRTALAEEAAQLEGFAARLLGDAAAMRLGPAREGVPYFGDWAYGWVQSYVTSYRILARGLAELAQAVAVEGEAPLAARLAEEMAAPIREEFRARVLAPVLRDGGFGADVAHVGAALDAAWGQALARQAARLAALPPAAKGDAAQTLHLAAAAAPLTPVLLAEAPTDPMAMMAEDGADSGSVFLRSMRPMAARLGAVAVRLSEAGSIITASGAFGYALGGFPGTAVGLAAGIGASWAIDWLFNRLDASLNRAAFEDQALEAIARAERRLAGGATQVAQAALAQRLAALDTAGVCR
jgi:hypothetical protein